MEYFHAPFLFTMEVSGLKNAEAPKRQTAKTVLKIYSLVLHRRNECI